MRPILRMIAVTTLSLGIASAAEAERPERVASAGGVLTEIAFLLGAGDRIVGVDSTSLYPPEAREKAQIGYFQRLSAEGVLSLTPDTMLATSYAGPVAALNQIRDAGVDVRVAPGFIEVEELPEYVRFVGAALGLETQSDAAAARLQAEIDALAEARPAGPGPRIVFLMTVRDHAPLVAGTGVGPDSVIRFAGGVNAADVELYKPVTPESFLAMNPDILMMTDEHAAVLGGIDKVVASPLFGPPGAPRPRTLTVPALSVLSIGPRTPDTIRRLRAAF